MSRTRKKQPADLEARKGTSSGRAIAAIVVVAVAAIASWALWRPRPLDSPAPSAGATATAPSPTSPAFAPLIGNWVRPDGGYVLSVSGIAADGTATVAYFNPRPIRVGRAEARREEAGLGLFVEFDDRDYPGSKYTLTYDGRNDVLRGIYYQAVQRASYDVAFVRRH
jgi:hypothetical protein